MESWLIEDIRAALLRDHWTNTLDPTSPEGLRISRLGWWHEPVSQLCRSPKLDPRQKYLLRAVLNGCLPTRAWLHAHHYDVCPFCPVCPGRMLDDTYHRLFICRRKETKRVDVFQPEVIALARQLDPPLPSLRGFLWQGLRIAFGPLRPQRNCVSE